MTPAIEALRLTVSVYADTDDERRILTATSKSHPRPGEPKWTGLTMGNLRTLLALVDAQAARIDKALAAHYNDEGDGVTQPYCLHDGREWPCPTVRSLTEDTL